MILVTGANGLVGNFVCQEFANKGMSVRAMIRESSDLSWMINGHNNLSTVTGDILDIASLEAALAGVETVVHCAAIVSFNPRDRKKVYKVNVEGTQNIVNACLKKGVKKLIHLSSVAALGKPKETAVLDEKAEWVKNDLTSAYAESKYLAELEVWRGESEGLEVLILNPSIILGPSDWEKSSTRIFKYVYDSNSFYTAGNVNYVDVRDLSQVIADLHSKGISGERFIVNGDTTSFKNLFDIIGKFFDRKPPSIKINIFWLRVALVLEKIRMLFTSAEPYITKESIQLAKQDLFYDNAKVKSALNYQFRDLDETLRWACQSILNKERPVQKGETIVVESSD